MNLKKKAQQYFMVCLIAGLILTILFPNVSIINSQSSKKLAAKEASAGATIYRDEFGVPHIYGKTDADAVFGFGYAQAEDNFFLLEDGFIKAIGRSAEIHGEEELLYDQAVRALEITRLADEEYKGATKAMRAIYDAYSEGINHFLRTHTKIKPVLLNRIQPWHTIALLKYKYYVLEYIWNAGISKNNFRVSTAEPLIEKKQGSNAWAVSPVKSASGNALLFQNPHVPFYGAAPYYEGHLHSEEGLNFSGTARYGFPFPYIGHNDYLGWSYTDNDIDIGDLYKETFDNQSNPLSYKYGNEYKTAVEWKEKIKVKKGNGMEVREITFRKTHHGPIVSEYEKKPIAVRLSKLGDGGWYDQWYAMLKAKSFSEFKTILKNINVPYMNIIYADMKGNIFYCYYGAVPKRSSKFNWRQPVDGSNPETEWNKYHSFEELPQVLNPSSGFIQNCNSSPFLTTTTGNPEPGNFPQYMVGYLDSDNPRSKVSKEILTETEKFSFESWQKAATDTRVYSARSYKEKIIAEYENLNSVDVQRAEKIIDLINELKSWNCISSKESVAMTLYVMSAMSYITSQDYKNYNYQISVPGIQRLEVVKNYLEKKWGTWKVAWGEINRTQRVSWDGKEPFDDKKLSYPIAGGPGNVGIVFNFYWTAEDFRIDKPRENKRRYGTMGNSYVAVVEFGQKIKAKSIVYYGQSGEPGSPNYFDQAKLYSEGKFKPAWFYPDEIIKHSKPPYHINKNK